MDFKTLKPNIIKALQEKMDKGLTGIDEDVTLIEGMFCYFLYSSTSLEIKDIKGEIPMVALLGNDSSQVYMFALKALVDVDGMD